MEANLSSFQLHVITDGVKQTSELVDVVKQTIEGGADAIQLRYKSAPAKDLWELGSQLLPLVSMNNRKLLINDRVDVALGLGAQGVHLAGKSLPPQIVRNICDTSFLIGCSVHSLEEAQEAQQLGASYVTFGHIFSTNSKPGLPPRGIQALSEVVSAVSIPVIAIGGITTENITEVLGTGCAGIAVIGAIMNDKHPTRATYELKNRMVASHAKPKIALPI